MSTKNRTTALLILLTVTLIVAVSYAIYFRSMYNEEKNSKIISTNKRTLQRKTPIKKGENVAALKNRVKELEYQLQAKIMPMEVEVQNSRKYYAKSGSQKETLEEMKISDPERYERIMNNYKRVDGKITGAVQKKLLYFNELDTNWMTSDQKENHNKLLEKLAKFDEFAQNNLNKDGEELQDTLKQKHSMIKDLYQDLRAEKGFLINDIGRQYGLSEEDSQSLKQQLNNIDNITSYRSFYRRKNKK